MAKFFMQITQKRINDKISSSKSAKFLELQTTHRFKRLLKQRIKHDYSTIIDICIMYFVFLLLLYSIYFFIG